MVRILRNLRIDEISSVDRAANEMAKIRLLKRDDETSRRPDFREIFKLDPSAIADTDIDDADDDDDGDDLAATTAAISDPKFETFISLLTEANPELTRQQAVYFLLHNAHGRALAQHLASVVTKTEKEEPPMSRIVELTKLTKFIEDDPGNLHAICRHIEKRGETSLSEADFTALLTSHCKKVKASHESVMGCFSRLFETDPEIRKAHAICKAAQMSLVPTQVSGEDALDVNDASAAYNKLSEMAEAQRNERRPSLRLRHSPACSKTRPMRSWQRKRIAAPHHQRFTLFPTGNHTSFADTPVARVSRGAAEHLMPFNVRNAGQTDSAA
jgi:hypothetical protein